jgi:glycosyltransferase involved in cell wall biosynthesis
MREIFDQHGVTHRFAGFIPHSELPEYYAQSWLLLLPTSGDCWGVVINEAMLAGTPVITTPWTGAAGELVLHESNGYILPLELERWVSAACDLLSNAQKWELFSRCAQTSVRDFNYDAAADGIIDALVYLSNK